MRIRWYSHVIGVVLVISGLVYGLLKQDSPVTTPVSATHCQPRVPATCGQLRIADSTFFDYHGQWVMHGMQFFLPQYGINGRTLWDSEYQRAISDGTLVYWLDQADQYLHANSLRIFVDLPYEQNGRLVIPTSYSTLFDFASQANARDMRIGISLHNNDDWALTAERQVWIEEMLSYFLHRDSLAMIAYLNLDNEINNYCDSTHTLDCFTFMDQGYIDQAIAWVRQGRGIIKARTPQMLITVGMSTELATEGQQGGASNFFRHDHTGATIAQLVDFLAPTTMVVAVARSSQLFGDTRITVRSCWRNMAFLPTLFLGI